MQLQRVWRDKDGRIVLWQRPNIWLIIWALAAVIGFLLGQGSAADAVHWIGRGALIIWAALEIWRGVNYFRRGLGLVVLLITLASIAKTIH